MKERSEKQRIVALIPAGTLFLIGIPLFLVFASPYLDRWLSIPNVLVEPFNEIIAALLIAVGLFFAGWAVLAQFRIGRGTPIPVMPPQKLVTTGPFAYCRNPMSFGTILYYLGIGFWVGSPSLIGLTTLIALILLTYIKLVEEKELEARFGQEYVEYMKRTPFITPRRRRNR